MQRDLMEDLVRWKSQVEPMPLLLRGARQVGKTYIVEQFGREHFEHLVTINFEVQPDLARCFDTLEPADILNRLYLITHQKIEPQKTLLFLDEIQECPNAIRALRYFKERMPQQHVIGAGSLLEITLNDAEFRMPVGRIQPLYLKPLSFKEYLVGSGNQQLRTYIENIHIDTEIDDVVHENLLKLIREYMVLGGMPAALNKYFSNRNIGESLNIQTAMLNTYRQDFGKYASKADYRYLQMLYERVPNLVGDVFKYSKVDQNEKSRDIKRALYLLEQAGLIYIVYHTSASGLPLFSLINEKKFKVLFLDIGLMMRAARLEAQLLWDKDVLLVNRGKLAEQFVGQEMLAYGSTYEAGGLHYWSRDKPSSLAEVDYITAIGEQIIPIEVKAGSTGRLKSIKLFMDENSSNLGIRISQQPLLYHDNLLSLPLYMVGEMARLVKELK